MPHPEPSTRILGIICRRAKNNLNSSSSKPLMQCKLILQTHSGVNFSFVDPSYNGAAYTFNLPFDAPTGTLVCLSPFLDSAFFGIIVLVGPRPGIVATTAIVLPQPSASSPPPSPLQNDYNATRMEIIHPFSIVAFSSPRLSLRLRPFPTKMAWPARIDTTRNSRLWPSKQSHDVGHTGPCP